MGVVPYKRGVCGSFLLREGCLRKEEMCPKRRVGLLLLRAVGVGVSFPKCVCGYAIPYQASMGGSFLVLDYIIPTLYQGFIEGGGGHLPTLAIILPPSLVFME